MVERNTDGRSIYRLKVTIKNVRPPIWRRIEVPADMGLGDLHMVLQTAFGWTDSHLHQFHVRGVRFGIPDPGDFDFGPPVQDARRARLGDVVGDDVKKLVYEYDFGDGWEHDIVVEGVILAENGVAYPRCVTGRRACPPEDCGGPWGYGELLEVIADPDHPEHDAMRE